MAATAPHFFHDLNFILIEYCFLQICKLTDPARSFGRENLTVKHINELLEKEMKLTREISQASDGIASYRDLIVDSRNKIISHADKDSILKDGTLGEHQREDVIQFFKCLYSYVDEVGNAVYHNLPTVKNMYTETFNLKFPDIKDVYIYVLKRHDLVHRNGKTKEGKVVEIDQSTIQNLTLKVNEFVEKIIAELKI
jgi:hypothetical protein